MDWLTLARELGLPITFLILAVWAFLSEKIHPGWYAIELRQRLAAAALREEKWRDLAFKLSSQAERAMQVVEKKRNGT